MPIVSSLRTLLVEQIEALYHVERLLARAMSALANAAHDLDLKSALDQHAAETQTHVVRLEQVFEELDAPVRARRCDGIDALVDECVHHVRQPYATRDLRDVELIASAQQLEHYEIAAYGTAAAHARLLELHRISTLLELTLQEEKAMDRTLSAIAFGAVNPGAVDSEMSVSGAHSAPASRRT
jgi:ferritin-like metal-binding protein YciE